MSAGLSGASQPERVPISGSGLLFACTATAAAAVGFPFDPVLAGMVAAGQGIQAICLYLGLTRPALDEHLVRLGLRTPHERPLRKPGPRGWSVLDTIRLIGWRVAGIHPETIGQRLGRSANAVRAKARRLGLPRPDRKSLQRVDPAGLKDPGPAIAFVAPAEEAEAPSQSPSAECGAMAGVVPVRPGQLADGSNSSRPAALLASPVAPSTPGDSANAQGELPLVCVDPAKSAASKTGHAAGFPPVGLGAVAAWRLRILEGDRRASRGGGPVARGPRLDREFAVATAQRCRRVGHGIAVNGRSALAGDRG